VTLYDPKGTDAGYEEIAVSAIDKVEEFGECRIRRVADPERLRRVIRREARRRRVKIVTKGWEAFVVVATDQPSIPAQAYGHVRFEHLVDSGDIDPSVRVIDAAEV